MNAGGAFAGCAGGGGVGAGAGGAGGTGGVGGFASTRGLEGPGLGWEAAGFAKGGGGWRVILLIIDGGGGKAKSVLSTVRVVVRANPASLDGLYAAELNGGGGSFLILERIGETGTGLLRGGGGKLKPEFGVMAGPLRVFERGREDVEGATRVGRSAGRQDQWKGLGEERCV